MIHFPPLKSSLVGLFLIILLIQISPPEHISHVMWGAVKYEFRLHLLMSVVSCVAIIRALLALPALKPDTLVKLSKDNLPGGKGKRWFSSGAYAGHVMRVERLYQFMVIYGPEEGKRLHTKYVADILNRAGKGF